MSYASRLRENYSLTYEIEPEVLAANIEALNDCAQACTSDAGDDLNEPSVNEMVRCIGLCMDCADICTATVRIISRQTKDDVKVTERLLEACIGVCKACGDECERHAQMHQHCLVCAQVCRRCERACQELLEAIRRST